MDEPKPEFNKRYEDIMRNAEKRRRRSSLIRPRGEFTAPGLVNAEIDKLAVKLAREKSQSERIFLKAEIAFLRDLSDRLARRSKKKPPEAGIAVPAVPPKGPLPKEGGAEAPLDFDA
ncbi:hypothetical protein [Erythrobacter sp. MTPC3]|uniref:hypothetical protein n=1 Tax=Erythrobacter sp. MTPC3 TaxID=3056564 RepID=UPI0036F22411